MVNVRRVLMTLALAFTAYQAARGMIWTETLDRPWLMVLMLVIYIVVTGLCLFMSRPPDAEQPAPKAVAPAPDGKRRRARSSTPIFLPLLVGLVALPTTIIVPPGAALAVGLSVQDVQDWPDILQSVTADDVMAAAKLALNKDNAVTGWLTTKESAQ